MSAVSTASLPAYAPSEHPLLARTPSYAQEPRAEELRIAHALVTPRARTTSDFVKQSRSGGLSLRLAAQAAGTDIPTYGLRAPIEGTVELAKTDGLSFVAVKVEGVMKLKEIAEGGTTTSVLCNETRTLWRRGDDPSPCPSSLPFTLTLPTHYADERGNYPLPPTFEAHLTGLPGFTANVDYQVTAVASRSKLPALGLSTTLSALTGLGQISVATPFLYRPRTCPASPLPPPLRSSPHAPGLEDSADWRAYETSLVARAPGARPIQAKFFVPRAHVFCFGVPIPFHVAFTSSAVSLASLLPFLPAPGRGGGGGGRSATRVQLLRQTCVDVRDDYKPAGVHTELWRVQNIGEGVMRRSVDGPRWLCFSGEIQVSADVKVGAFKASGLWVRDCIVFTITPADALKGPIGDARLVVPIRLVTDPYAPDAPFAYPRVSPPGSDELLDDAASLPYEQFATAQ